MTCNSILKTPVNAVSPPLDADGFSRAEAILEEAMFSRSLDYRQVQIDEFLTNRLNGTLFVSSYVVSLPNGNQFIVQFKYIIRKTSQTHFFVIHLIDMDSILSIFEEDRYEFLTSFLDPDQHPDRNAPNYSDEDFRGFSFGDFSLQIIDEKSESFTEGMPRSVEAILTDHTGNELAEIGFQRILRAMMSHFARERPEL
jgi:hypothetical protein